MYRILTSLTTEHDLRLVVVAGLICFLASLVAINLLHRARATSGKVRLGWMVTAGATTGSGIWATHFIAMLGYDPGIAVAYNTGLTMLSLLAAATVTGIGLAIAASVPARWNAAVGGAVVGGGVACMHYLGMSAVELPGHVHWNAGLVIASIVIGMLVAMAALQVAERYTSRPGTLVAAVLLTLAIVSHHFTAMGAVEIVPDPTRVINAFSLSPGLLAVAIAGIATAVLSSSLAGALVDRRLRERNSRLASALDNMTQALCMFDGEARLIICNERYLQLYHLTREHAYPGCPLRELLEYRKASGTFFQDIDDYVAAAKRRVVEGKVFHNVVEVKGRAISISNRPIVRGGWVSTHEDITEQRQADQERSRLAAEERRRATIDTAIASFRQRAENMLSTVSNNAHAMRATATALFAASQQASQRAQGAVDSTNEASVNVESAASAAEELSASIAEISRQLGQTNSLVGIAVGEAGTTNTQIGGTITGSLAAF